MQTKLYTDMIKYAIAFFGSIIYNYVLFVIAKNKCDQEEKDFPYLKYFKMNWDNWGLTFMLAPVLVWYMPDSVGLINAHMATELGEHEVFYLGAGPLTEVLLFGMFKLLGWKDTWVAPVHKD